MMVLPTGEIRYAAPGPDGRIQVALLTYRVDGEYLVTNQPSAQTQERTGFRFVDHDHLELAYSGGRAAFVRAT